MYSKFILFYKMKKMNDASYLTSYIIPFGRSQDDFLVSLCFSKTQTYWISQSEQEVGIDMQN